MAEAGRLIEQGGVSVEGERRTQSDFEVNLTADRAFLVQVAEEHFDSSKVIPALLDRLDLG